MFRPVSSIFNGSDPSSLSCGNKRSRSEAGFPARYPADEHPSRSNYVAVNPFELRVPAPDAMDLDTSQHDARSNNASPVGLSETDYFDAETAFQLEAEIFVRRADILNPVDRGQVLKLLSDRRICDLVVGTAVGALSENDCIAQYTLPKTEGYFDLLYQLLNRFQSDPIVDEQLLDLLGKGLVHGPRVKLEAFILLLTDRIQNWQHTGICAVKASTCLMHLLLPQGADGVWRAHHAEAVAIAQACRVEIGLRDMISNFQGYAPFTDDATHALSILRPMT